MSREQIVERLIPRPRSRFLLVSCLQCGNKQIFPETVKIRVTCNVCGETLAHPTGGKAKIIGKVEKVLE
ncbi:MAG: 30S ribosomal protein S27e [Nitrososphaerota archaeon]|nr:30S ribosomal protein S27e [Candidatus Calditenuaceae archaeon]MDW8073315.1 30S ribosomal protein S27e [Nitrososphaerota archaeon]